MHLSIRKCALLVILSFVTFASLNSYAVETESLSHEKKDPYERFNRAMFKFNEQLDKCCLKPAAKLYKKIVPRPLNKGVHHIFQHLHSGSAIFNDLLQANFYQATSDSWRFVINSTVGIGGFFDVATNIGLPYNQTHFGITLAKWGYRDSNYIVLPFWGPSTVRDTIALPVNYLTSIYPYISSVSHRSLLIGTQILDARTQALRFEDVYEIIAIDPYLFSRDAYLQHANYLIKRSYELDNPYMQKEAEQPQEAKEVYYLEE